VVTLTETKIEIQQKILFDPANSEVLPASFALLDEVAQVLKTHPTLRVRIEGHTDDQGATRMNRRLSEARAESVKRVLVTLGVAPSRLETRGFGPDRPLTSNSTAEGREKNRRVEFVIIH
jgi:outer membrane protein OmpA-like peptidoglycan-associated protein